MIVSLKGDVMVKKIKLITVTILAIGLIFGGTLSFSEAASESTAKTIEKLKKEVKKLTASNKAKDKEIAKLKKEAKAKNEEVKKLNNTVTINTKDLEYQSDEIIKLKKDIQDKNRSLKGVEGLKKKYGSFISYYIQMSSKEYSATKDYCQLNPDETCNQNVRINSSILYLDNMYDYISKEELQDTVINSFYAHKAPWVNPEKVILGFPNGDVVINLR